MSGMRTAIEDAIETLKENTIDGYEPSESIAELADQAVPIYHSERLVWAMNNVGLATETSEFTTSESSAIDIIGWNIYEKVSAGLWEWYNEQDWTFCAECGRLHPSKDLDENDLCDDCPELEDED